MPASRHISRSPFIAFAVMAMMGSDSPAPRMRRVVSKPSMSGIWPAAGRVRILIAKDNLVNQKVAVRLVQKLGFAADVAANGVEALAALDRARYDLILMDCRPDQRLIDGAPERIAPQRLVQHRAHRPPRAPPWLRAWPARHPPAWAGSNTGNRSQPISISHRIARAAAPESA